MIGNVGWAGGSQVPDAVLNPPVNATGVVNGFASITVSWTPPVKASASGYRVYHADNDRTFAAFETWGVNTTNILSDDQNNPFQPDTEYRFIVVTTDGSALESTDSNLVIVKTAPATSTGSGILVANPKTPTGYTFDDPKTVSGAQGSGLLVARPRTNTGLRFVDPTGALPPPTPVAAPTITGLSTISDTALQLTWQDNQINPSDSFLIYVVEAISGNDAPNYPKQVGGTNSSQTIALLTAATSYNVSMTATVGADTSGLSNIATATTAVDNTQPPSTGLIRDITFEGYADGADASVGNDPNLYNRGANTTISSVHAFRGAKSAKSDITIAAGVNTNWGGGIDQPGYRINDGEEFWIRIAQRFDANWRFDTGPSAGMKWFRSKSNKADDSHWGYADIYLRDSNDGQGILWFIQEGQTSRSGNPGGGWVTLSNVTDPATGQPYTKVPLGTWHTLELYMSLDSTKTDDGGTGRARIWWDNVLVMDDPGVQPISDPGGYHQYFLLGNYINNGAKVDSSVYTDNVQMANSSNLPSNTDSAGNLFIGGEIGGGS